MSTYGHSNPIYVTNLFEEIYKEANIFKSLICELTADNFVWIAILCIHIIYVFVQRQKSVMECKSKILSS